MKFILFFLFFIIITILDFQFISTKITEQSTDLPFSDDRNTIKSKPLHQEDHEKEPIIKKNLNEPYSKTDDEVIEREEEAIKLEGLNVAQLKEMREKAEKFQFQAEVDRMMKLIINSLYTNKEIFLRELISNASDALDKLRFLSLTDPSILEKFPELSIKIKADKINNMLRITDTGIGMTRNELVKQLGTIAKSGTTEFLSKIEKEKMENLNDFIGQFGVGFYSVFLVADSVTVISKSDNDDQYIWESDSSNTFSVTKDPRGDTLGRGTEVVLRLKDSAKEYLESENLRRLIRQYSQYLSFPIYLWTSKSVENAVDKSQDAKSEKEKQEPSDPQDDSLKKKKSPSIKWDWERINSQKPIWTKKPAEVTDEEYDEFFKALSKTSEKPLSKIHFSAEGEVSFKALLYIPSKAPGNLFEREVKESSIRLYVRRVFITDKIRDMIPRYLSFIIGIVDSDDLPLNVSRETLQQEKLMKVIQKKLVRKALDMIKKLKNEDYEIFWKEFRNGIKMGLIDDDTNRNRLTKLFKTHSSKSKTIISFSDYVSRMKSQQEEIFYVVGENLEETKNSPFIEKFLKYDYEVLYFTDTLDEHALHLVEKYEGTKLLNLARGGVLFDRTEGSKSILVNKKQEFKPLVDFMKIEMDDIKDFVENILLTDRLISVPMMLVPQEQGWTGNMERLARSQSSRQEERKIIEQHLKVKKNIEINYKHPIIIKLNHMIKINSDPKNDPLILDWIQVLFDTAILNSGYLLKEVTKYTNALENIAKFNFKTYGNISDDDLNESEEFDDKDNSYEYDENLSHAVPQDASKYATDESDETADAKSNENDSESISDETKKPENIHNEL